MSYEDLTTVGATIDGEGIPRIRLVHIELKLKRPPGHPGGLSSFTNSCLSSSTFAVFVSSIQNPEPNKPRRNECNYLYDNW